MIQLSYTTLNMVHTASHNWVNKLMGLKPEDHDYYHDGKKAHDAIQKHVSGKLELPELEHIKYRFPIVEEVDFDERCKFNCTLEELMLNATPKKDAYVPQDHYNVIGFFDGLNRMEKEFLEIKSASKMWSVGQFNSLMQRKLYSLAMPEFKFAICIACLKDINKWKYEKPRTYAMPLLQRDRDEALNWILEGIRIIESGDFTGGLNEEGRCADNARCYYGINCSFK